MAEMYVVYVAAPRKEPTPEERRHLAEVLKLDSSKLEALLRRLPAKVTKPVPESTAITVARTFREAGLEASIQPPGPVAPSATDKASREGSGGAFGRTGQAEVSKEGQQAEPANPANDDVLFPESSFAPKEGPNAPSKPMLFALLTVVLVLAALWVLL